MLEAAKEEFEATFVDQLVVYDEGYYAKFLRSHFDALSQRNQHRRLRYINLA
jgi:hypothetical protein